MVDKEKDTQVVNELEARLKELRAGRRTPLQEQNPVGIVEQPGWTYCQVVENPGAVQRYLRAGWIPCGEHDISLRDDRVQNDHNLGTVLREVVNRHPELCPTAIWMKIPTEIFEEDQKAEAIRRREREKAYNPVEIAKFNPEYYGAKLEERTKI